MVTIRFGLLRGEFAQLDCRELESRLERAADSNDPRPCSPPMPCNSYNLRTGRSDNRIDAVAAGTPSVVCRTETGLSEAVVSDSDIGVYLVCA